jgi:transposase
MYREGNRYEQELFPKAIEDYVALDHMVRAYNDFIEAIRLVDLGIEIDDNKLGASQYHPKVMLKILVYGYSCGIRSSRKLEKAVNECLPFMWLSSGLKPDFKTIAKFRKDNKEALIKLLKESVNMSVRMDMLEGNCLFMDGSKIRGNCGIGRSRSKQEIARQIKQAQKDIEEMAKRVEKDDEQDSEGKSLVFIEGIKSKEDLKDKLEDVLRQMQEDDMQEINTTDPESIKFKSRQGTHSGYNAQVITDEKAGLIVSAQVVRKNNDVGQIEKQTLAAEENLGKKSKIVCADSGYHNRRQIKELMDGEREVIVPSQKEVNKERTGKEDKFDKSKFKYDRDKDVYLSARQRA